MSSDNQRYSTENQRDAIAEYARLHGYRVVGSYVDAGKSGLSLQGRVALKQLLSDALAPQRSFDTILVLDVSRWGRFQNPDQAGHYEFLCRQAGVNVVYCGEPFGVDIEPANTIVKHLKRVMAGEYSRELSARLSRAHCQQARLGFRQGSRLIYGFRRLLVDQNRNPRQVLRPGERKALATDRVIVIPGPPEELAVIRRIFRLFVHEELSAENIARRLAAEGVKGYGKASLSASTIRRILHSELCIGQMTYNLTTKRLQNKEYKNPEELWTRFAAFKPIVPPSQFQKAQERLARMNRQWTRGDILEALKQLLAEKGRLTEALIDQSEGGPSAPTVADRFGSLSAAYAAVGYEPPRTLPFGMNGKSWSKKAIVTGLQKLYNAKDFLTGRLIDSCPDLPSAATIKRYFGTMQAAMAEAGLPYLSHSQAMRLSWQRRKNAGCDEFYRGIRWTNGDLLRALRRLERKHGFLSMRLLDQNGETPNASFFIKTFGSLEKARQLAHLPPRSHSQLMIEALKRKREGTDVPSKPRDPLLASRRRSRPGDIIEGLQRLARRQGMVSARLIDEDPSLPSWATVANYFGSLSAAYKLAGLVRLDGKPVRFGYREHRPPSRSRT